MITRVPRELGRSCSSIEDNRIGSNRYSQLRDDPSAMRLRPSGDETQGAPKVSPSEGNEVRREDCQEVAAPHSSVEAGERAFRTPWSEGGAALWTGSWNHAEDIVPHQRVTAKRPGRVRDSESTT